MGLQTRTCASFFRPSRQKIPQASAELVTVLLFDDPGELERARRAVRERLEKSA
jgi:hypothetical protein